MGPSVRKLSRITKAWISVIIGLILPLIVIIISLIRDIASVAYASAFASAILLYLSFMYWEFGDQLEDFNDNLKDLKSYVANTATITPIREPNFYDRLCVDIEEADNRVWISYLDNKSPLESHDDGKVSYYEELGEIIEEKSSGGVEFRRLVRAIPQMDSFIQQMLENREGISRYSLACLPDDNPQDRSKPHVAVQLVDDDITYFVAVGEQQETVEPRDMFIRSMELNDQWSRYYQRMWNESYEILRRGQIQPDELEAYEEHIDSLRDDVDG